MTLFFPTQLPLVLINFLAAQFVVQSVLFIPFWVHSANAVRSKKSLYFFPSNLNIFTHKFWLKKVVSRAEMGAGGKIYSLNINIVYQLFCSIFLFFHFHLSVSLEYLVPNWECWVSGFCSLFPCTRWRRGWACCSSATTTTTSTSTPSGTAMRRSSSTTFSGEKIVKIHGKIQDIFQFGMLKFNLKVYSFTFKPVIIWLLYFILRKLSFKHGRAWQVTSYQINKAMFNY